MLGNDAMGHLFEEGSLQQVALLLRQVGQSTMQAFGILPLLHLRIGGRRIVGDEGRVVHIELRATVAAMRVYPQVSGYSEYPGGDVASRRIEKGGLVPDRHHRFLHQFLSGLRIAHLP